MSETNPSWSEDRRRALPGARRLWIGWVLACLMGYGVGGPAGVALGVPGYIIENGFLSISLSGIITGLLQWLLLRRRFSPTAWWVPASIIAAAVFAAVVFGGLAIGTRAVVDVTWILGASGFALMTGWLQWRLVLGRQLSSGGRWWVPAGLLGWLAGGIVGGMVGAAFGLSGKEGGLPSLLVWSVFGTLYGVITGLVLLRLLRRPLTVTNSRGGAR